MRTLAAVAALALALPLGLAAQADEQAPPEGWSIRADRSGADVSDVLFVDMPPGWHVTTGPAVILWDPDMVAGGRFSVEMEVYLFDPGERREAFGFFVGGDDLDNDAQSYLYFLIREGGEFLVKTREGRNTSTLVDWTAHPSIRAFAELEEGSSSQLNVLAIEAGESHVRFLVNGDEVTRIPRDGLDLDGVVGMRVNHALNLHVSRLDVSPAGGLD